MCNRAVKRQLSICTSQNVREEMLLQQQHQLSHQRYVVEEKGDKRKKKKKKSRVFYVLRVGKIDERREGKIDHFKEFFYVAIAESSSHFKRRVVRLG